MSIVSGMCYVHWDLFSTEGDFSKYRPYAGLDLLTGDREAEFTIYLRSIERALAFGKEMM
ncbi:hypothetical protein HMPREF0105_1006 [Bacteroides sp. 3_1_33FAA]|nr:hypothetical protein HMPREF0105_1006 [Bacteroides sp. 3_1_33FAA]